MEPFPQVSNAIRHASALAREAEELGDDALARALRERAERLSGRLEEALSALGRIEPAKEARVLAHGSLASVLGECCAELEEILDPEDALRLLPAGRLDAAERARFLLRRLDAVPTSGTSRAVEERLSRALFAYEACVDAYLLACAEARARKEGVIAESQVLRLDLERAKRTLLALAPAGSPRWRRIQARCVRTKPAAWLRGALRARARGLAERAEGLEPRT